MPLTIPNIDDRRYQQLVDESLARIPVHTPEWTNFNQSDPGVTLIQVFAFLTESLLYRANQIPERNRKKFLQLLGVPLQPAASARGIVTIQNERGPLQTITLNDDIEVRAGSVSFRTERGMDVLPIEAKIYFKELRRPPPPEQKEAREAYDRDLRHYQELQAALLQENDPSELQLYRPTPLPSRGAEGVDLGNDTVDQKLWIALLIRANDKPPQDLKKEVRRMIAGKTLSLGIVPRVQSEQAQRRLRPGGDTGQGAAAFAVESPIIPSSGGLPKNRKPTYRTIATAPVLVDPQVVEVTLPSDETQLDLWNDIDPLEHGTDDLPPTLEDSALNDRVITWLRLNWGEGARARIQWVGINAAFVNQRARVGNELLPDANGEPDQEYTLANKPVIPESVRITIRTTENQTEVWKLTDDLMAAGAEAPARDPRHHPGVATPALRPSKVFMVDAEAGKIRFGDGFHGARPPLGASLRVDYDYGSGAEGNVGENAISSAPSLPAGLTVSNPLRTWGGARAETIAEGEKQITRFLQNRDRLVNAVDFETIAMRTPGVELARVEVLAAYNPMLARHEPGNAPGAVTLMVIPRYSPKRPDAPEPDELFLKAICDYLEPRRLVTTELFLNGPQYQPIYISVGISVVAGRNFSAAVVREQVAQRLKQFLSPIPPIDSEGAIPETLLLGTPIADVTRKGWPLRTAVFVRELEAEVARVPGVAMVNGLLLAGISGPEVGTSIEMQGLQLPRIDGIQVTVGPPTPIANVRGDIDQGPPAARTMAPVPAIPKEC